MEYTLHFTASDALIESEFERLGLTDPETQRIPQQESMELGPFPDYVELTYEYLRVGPDGDHIAVLDNERGGWVIGVTIKHEGVVNVLDGTGPTDAPVYSDVAITAKEG